MTTVSSQQLTADLKAVINDAEALLKATAGDAGTKLGGVRDRLQESLVTARAQVSGMEEAVIAKSKAAAEATDRYVHDNPWQSIGVIAAVGLLIGILLGNSRR